MALKDKADEYFQNINSMANRLYVDLNEIKESYTGLWNDLSEGEKTEIFNDTIIRPEACLQYSGCANIIIDSCKNKKRPSKKRVDNNYTFNDEHSGPFRFRTPSQENLHASNTACLMTNSACSIGGRKNGKSGKSSASVAKKIDENSSQQAIDVELSLPITGLELLDNW